MNAGTVGARAYSGVERKRKKRQASRANRGRISARRRRSARDRNRALRQKGLLPGRER